MHHNIIKCRLYIITCQRRDMSYEKTIEQACAGGADIVQLRATELNDGDLLAVALKLRKITRKYKVPLIINNRLDVALASGADGLHIGQDDLPVAVVRDLVNRFNPDPASRTRYRARFIIGKSTHSLAQALATVKEDVDYISVGPIFATPTKPDYKPVGMELLKKVRKRVRKPIVVIGGIDKMNIKQVAKLGADMIAVVRAGCDAKDIIQAVRKLKEAVRG